jgi:hypothetical protein
MTVTKNSFTDSIRIISAITLKDITDAIKNKTIIGILIGVGFLMLSSQALSFILRVQDEPPAVIYDQGRSKLLVSLVRSRELRLGMQGSFDEMVSSVSQSSEPVLGLVVPVDFDDLTIGEGPIALQGYTSHWVNPSEVTELVIYFEEQLAQAAGQPVRISVDGNQVYPNLDDFGYANMVSTGIVLGVMTIGLILVPLLLIDEKENHTMDALMISPVRIHHLLIGKSLAGLSYSLIASLAIFAFSGYWVVHWWVMILGVILGGLSAVVTGLLLGSIFDNFTTTNLWVGLIIAVFQLPVFLWSSIAPKLPVLVRRAFEYTPSLAMSTMSRISFVETVPMDQVLLNMAVMGVFVLVMLGLVGLRIRRMDL